MTRDYTDRGRKREREKQERNRYGANNKAASGPCFLKAQILSFLQEEMFMKNTPIRPDSGLFTHGVKYILTIYLILRRYYLAFQSYSHIFKRFREKQQNQRERRRAVQNLTKSSSVMCKMIEKLEPQEKPSR